MFAAVVSRLPDDLFPGGAKSGWWAKTVQLDLEAKRVVARVVGRPLRWHRTKLSKRDGGSNPAKRTFDSVFSKVDDSIALVARHLRDIVIDSIPGVDEAVAGGSKVQIILYSLGDPNNVVCGIQPSKHCLFYLHRVQADDIPEYKLAGKGKHAKHIEFRSADEIDEKVIKRVVKLSISRLE